MLEKTGPILLVEDDASLGRSLGDFLKECGYPAQIAATMREAWEILVTLRPSLCLLDLNLPDGSGLDLLRRIVEQELPVRVIVMTAFPLQHLQPRYPTTRLAAWLTKPVPPEQLLKVVQAEMRGDQVTS